MPRGAVQSGDKGGGRREGSYVKKLLAVVSTLAWLATVPYCATVPITDDVPHFLQLSERVFRGAHPRSWGELARRWEGRTVHVVQLCFPSECDDDGARSVGFQVHALSIDPRTDPRIPSQYLNVLAEPDAEVMTKIEAIVRGIPRDPDGIYFFHCVHGNDRTGLVAALYRVFVQHWEPQRAFDEMVANGFHPALTGLTSYWMRHVAWR